MRRAWGINFIFLLSLLPVANVAPSFASTVQLPKIDANWIQMVNYYRQASGLAPVTEDQKLSSDVKKHITYLTKSDPKYFTGRYVSRHLENPSSPYYTKVGARSGQELTTTLTNDQAQSIDQWMSAPFHAMGFMREGLRKIGWASSYNPGTGFYDVGADVLDGLKMYRTKTITFPGNGSYMRMDNFPGEKPDPREGCGANWSSYTGLPIWVSLTTRPSRQMSAQIINPSGDVLSSQNQLCIVNEFNIKSSDPVYGPAGKAIVRADHMVLIIPKDPLTPGVQKVSLLLGGVRKISWSFTVIARPADIELTAINDPSSISWQAPPPENANPIVGYEVVVADSSMKKFEAFRTTSTTFSTAPLAAGNYWVCVRAIGQYRKGECPNFVSYTTGQNPN